MTRPPMPDPVVPSVTFDSYVIPETVKTQTTARPALAPNGAMLAAGVIGTLTFILGVLITLEFAAPRDRQLAETVVPQAAAPEAAPAPAAPPSEVTRQNPADLLSTPPKASAPATPQGGLTDVQMAVLRGLQPQRTLGKLTPEEMVQRSLEAQAIVNRNKMRMLREGVLAGIYTVTARQEEGRKRLVLETVNAPLTQESIANLLNAAAERGELDVPASLSAAGGGLDMDTMLFNLVQTSLATDGTPEGAEAAREMGRRAFAASNARTRAVQGQRLYTVQPGDSLAYISLQFYGRPNAYLRIFEANKDQLASPDLIRIGQRLIIPG